MGAKSHYAVNNSPFCLYSDKIIIMEYHIKQDGGPL